MAKTLLKQQEKTCRLLKYRQWLRHYSSNKTCRLLKYRQWLRLKQQEKTCRLLKYRQWLRLKQQEKTCRLLKAPPQLNLFASLILNSFCKKSNLPSIHCNLLAHLCNFKLLYVIFVKSSDKLLNYLMFAQTLSEVKMETL